jgi:hypothetical protein
MTIAANLDLARIECGVSVSDVSQNAKPSPGTSRGLKGRDQSFAERWQSLLNLDKTAAGKQLRPQAADPNQSSTIVDLQKGTGATIRASHYGEIEPHPRLRHQPAEGSQHKPPSTGLQTGVCAVEVNPAGTLLTPMIPLQAVAPDQYGAMNANQQTSSIKSIPPIGAPPLRIENLTQANPVRQGNGDLPSLAARPTEQMARHATDVTSQSTPVAEKASEASGSCEVMESTQPLPGPSVAGHAVTTRMSGAGNPADVAGPQVEPAVVSSNLTVSNQ